MFILERYSLQAGCSKYNQAKYPAGQKAALFNTTYFLSWPAIKAVSFFAKNSASYAGVHSPFYP
jgi:hypothetical protein